MKNTLLILNICVTLFLVSCNRNATEKTTTTPIPDAPNIEVKITDLALNKDLVCGMLVEEGGIADTASHENKMYGFCSTECKAEFVKDPQMYLAQQ